MVLNMKKFLVLLLLIEKFAFSQGKFVSLTFDDGPHPGYIPRIVRILEKYNARATFFVVGKMAEKYPDLIKLLVESGMELGNHTYSHRRLKYLRYEERIKEIEMTNKVIEKICGVHLKYLRPPGGRYDWEVITLAEKFGMEVILWDVNSNDSNKYLTEKEFFDGIFSKIRNGSIILLHTGSDLTLRVLEKLIIRLKRMGYKILTVSGLKKRQKKCLIYQEFKRDLF